MKKVLIGCGVLVLIPVVLFGALLVIGKVFEDEIAEHGQERRKEAVEGVDTVTGRLARAAASFETALPIEGEAPCPEGTRVNQYLPTSFSQLGQFTDSGYRRLNEVPLEWYRSKDISDLEVHLAKGDDPESWDFYDVARITKRILEKTHLLVLHPKEQAWPRLVDGEGFEGGWFLGHAVLVDFETGDVLCYAALQVESSESIEGVQWRVGFVPVGGTDMTKKLEEDFRENFWAGVAAGLDRIQRGP